MRARVLVLAALVAVTVQAQEAILISQTRALTLPLFAPDANTVSWAIWRGGAMVPLVGPAWTQNGTVPQVARTATMVAGAGPFTDLDFYSLPGSPPGSDVLDFAGDFSACVVIIPTPGDFTQSGIGAVFVSNGSGNVDGYYANWANGPGFNYVDSSSGTAHIVTTGASAVAGAVNVACFGRSGSSIFAQLNLGPLASAAGAIPTPATTTPAKLGRHVTAGFSMAGTLVEFRASTTPAPGPFAAQIQRVHQRLGITAW